MQLILWRHARDERFKLGERQLEAEGQASCNAVKTMSRHSQGWVSIKKLQQLSEVSFFQVA